MKTLPILVHATAAERAVMIEAARQLAVCLDTASGERWSIALSFDENGSSGIRLVSLLDAVENGEPMAAIAARWHARVAGWRGPAVVTTVFRHADPALLPRIRRLNDIVIALSRAHGIEVADVDRACALLGAAAMRSDWRLGDPHAALIAGHTIVAALLAADLAVSDDLLARARAIHGSLADLIARHPRTA